MKRIIIILCIAVGIISISSCKEKEFKDPNFYGKWKFENTQSLGGSTTMVDTGSVPGYLVLSINSDNNLYIGSGCCYLGQYEFLDEYKNISANIARKDFSGVASPWWVIVLMDVVNRAESYSIKEDKLVIFYGKSWKANFTKL